MAQWKETLEPYVKVIESVKTTSLNPSAGGDLILGTVLISDCGPSEPTLITSQKEFLDVYAAEDLTKDYVKSLDSLYISDSGISVSTMWLNAYRLAGSASLLVCRASKSDGIIYTKPFVEDSENDTNDYIIKDSEILKRMSPFKLVIDSYGSKNDGWAIAINEVGVLGNLIDDNGPRYDFYVDSLQSLVSTLNETNKFHAITYKFYSDVKCETETSSPSETIAVLFDEVYLAPNFLDTELLTDEVGVTDDLIGFSGGLAYLFSAEKNWQFESQDAQGENQDLIRLNDSMYSGFKPFDFYASNLYNTKSDLSVRIRRFNHDAVVSKVTKNPEESPWIVLGDVIETNSESESFKNHDFYEFLISDPSISEEPIMFNVGNLPGRGDITIDDLKNSLGMIYLNLPDNLLDLKLNYYGYNGDDTSWKNVVTLSNPTFVGDSTEQISFGDKKEVVNVYVSLDKVPNDLAIGSKVAIQTVQDEVSGENIYVVYELEKNPQYPYSQLESNVSLKKTNTGLLNVTDSDVLKAWDKIEDDERFVVEGFSDLGCTAPNIQSYIANIAENSNYFYAFSTVNVTNYMTIANKANKIKMSHKLYAAAPWDYDDATVGFQFPVSPSIIYWECVLRNRRNNNEFAGVFGQNTGRVSVMNLAKDFKKSERQLLLSKKINTISYDNYLGSYYFNDNYTHTEESHVLSEECNSRLQIRISKAMPILLNQFKGRQNTSKTWNDMKGVIRFWFENTILRYNYTIAEYRIICDETNNTPETIRQNKVFVTIQVRFNSSIKFITVYNDAYPIGLEFSEA